MPQIRTYLIKDNQISDIYARKKNIDIFPTYQRNGDLWNDDKKQLFLDSIFNGFDIPKLYMHILKTPKKIKGNIVREAVIDGRQRLETIWGFIENKIPLGDFEIELDKQKIKTNGLYYKDISKEYTPLRTFFDNYKLPIVGVETNNDDLDPIEDMFLRLNEAVPLTSAEKRNAIGGKMISLIKKLSKHPFFKEKTRIPTKRYQHYEVCTRILYIEECIKNGKLYDTKKPNLDEFVRKYKVEQFDRTIEKDIKSTLDSMNKIFSKNDILLASQARIPIYYLLVREAKRQRILHNVTRSKIDEFVKKVEDNKEKAQIDIKLAKQDLLTYDRLTIQGTNDASSIQMRFHIIADKFNIDSSLIVDLGP